LLPGTETLFDEKRLAFPDLTGRVTTTLFFNSVGNGEWREGPKE